MRATNSGSLFYSAHLASRLFLGLPLLILALMIADINFGLLLSLSIMVLIYYVEQSWQRVVRTLRLLRWFIVPILLLHSLFSPGQYIFPGMPLSLTQEGVMQGVQLSIQFSAIFFAASFFFLCLKQQEWIKLILVLPFVHHEKSASYMLMVAIMQRVVQLVVHDFQKQWRMRKRWQDMPLLLLALFRTILKEAADHAGQLWLRWPGSLQLSAQGEVGSSPGGVVASLFCIGVGLLGLVLIWKA